MIAFITRSVVNVRTISNGFLLVSLVTALVSLEEECLPSFEVLNCRLNLVASCLDDENEIPLKVIASFSTSRFARQQVCLLVHGFNKVSIFAVCAHIYGSGWLYSILAVQVMWGLFYGGHLVCSSRPVSLLVQVPLGVCGVQYGCDNDAALSRMVRKIFSSPWQSVGRERLRRAASTSCLYLSQLAFLGSDRFDVALGWRASSSVI